MNTKPCECVISSCALPESISVTGASLSGRLAYYNQLYCQALDLRNVAESVYLFMTLLPEAAVTWSIPCTSV